MGGLTSEEHLLVDHFATLPSSLPPTDWTDQQLEAYVPAKYAVCLVPAVPRGPQTPPLDPAKALKALPARAAKLLRRRQAESDGSLGGSTCFVLTTGKARVLANELADVFGPPVPHVLGNNKYGFEIEAEVNRPLLKRFAISFNQLLPDGEVAAYYPLVN